MATAKYALQMAATQALSKGVTQIVGAGISLEVAKLNEQAAEAMHEAEKAEAAAKALEAMITMLRKTIEELQAQLEEMLNASMETMSILFQAIDDSSETMKQLHQSQAA
jgi:DNA anti-recombination protein RmuC